MIRKLLRACFVKLNFKTLRDYKQKKEGGSEYLYNGEKRSDMSATRGTSADIGTRYVQAGPANAETFGYFNKKWVKKKVELYSSGSFQEFQCLIFQDILTVLSLSKYLSNCLSLLPVLEPTLSR